MNFSFIIDVAIGLIFVYLLLSLMCSAANEIIELWLKKRAIDLERGLREMLAPGTPSGVADIVQKLYDHALINNLFDATYQNSRIASPLRYVLRTHLPSYIPARSFALALMDLVARPAAAGGASGATGATPPTPNFDLELDQPPAPPPPPGDANNPLTPLRQGILTSPLLDAVPEVRQGLIALVDAAGNDVAKARENIETWFNSTMDHVSSWYKRRTQVVILILGLFLTIAMNVDSLTITKRLSTDKALRESLVAASIEYAKAHATPAPTPKENAAAETNTEAAAGTGNTGGASGAGGANPTAKPSPAAAAAATPCPTPTPEVNLPAECNDLSSDACKTELPNFISECSDLESEACKTKTDLLSNCLKDPKSEQCKQARILFNIPACIADTNSFACKEEALLRSIPACNNCKPGGTDPRESPQCKLEFNQAQLEALNLPIGWGSVDDAQRKWPGWNFRGPNGWFNQIQWHWLGWLLTTLAISLGAPFWFDLLNKFIVIRSAVKPHEKSPEEESKD
jgi:hypothetical protein